MELKTGSIPVAIMTTATNRIAACMGDNMRYIGVSFKGRTTDFDSVNSGSIPLALVCGLVYGNSIKWG